MVASPFELVAEYSARIMMWLQLTEDKSEWSSADSFAE